LDFWIVEIAADPVRDSEHSCALSPDQKVADEWNSAEHRIERVCWKDAAAKIDGAGRTVDIAVDVDADGSYGRRVAHVQPITRPSDRNLCPRERDPLAPEHAGDAVERAEAENPRHDRCLGHAEVGQVDPSVQEGLLASIIDSRGERKLAAFGALENAGRFQ